MHDIGLEKSMRLLLFGNFYSDPVFSGMLALFEDKFDTLAERSLTLHTCAGKMIEWAEKYGISGNLPERYLAWLLVMDINVFTLAAERRGDPGGSLCALALHDLMNIRDVLFYAWGGEICHFGGRPFSMLENYTPNKISRPYDTGIIFAIEQLADSLKVSSNELEMYGHLLTFYRFFGVGELLLYRAFRWGGDAMLKPILYTDPIRLTDLVGYENQKAELVRNTEAFLAGLPADNVLLYGDSGTGKTSSVKALLNEYHSLGLRMVEINRQQLEAIPDIIQLLREREYKFILFLDDLSFEDFETEYKQLKMIIEGGLEVKPSNALVYATSNRRHLIKESWKDRERVHGDVHLSDTMQEKLSLVDRFGITLCYYTPQKDEYLQIISAFAKNSALDINEEDLHAKALLWEARRSGYSGRNARQFWDSMIVDRELNHKFQK